MQVNNNQLVFADQNTLANTLNVSDFSTPGIQEIYAQLNFTNNFTPIKSSTYQLKVSVPSATNLLSYDNSNYLADNIRN